MFRFSLFFARLDFGQEKRKRKRAIPGPAFDAKAINPNAVGA